MYTKGIVVFRYFTNELSFLFVFVLYRDTMAGFDKDKEFDIDVKIHIDPRLSQTKIASIKYTQGNNEPVEASKEITVSQSTSQNELKQNISENLKTIFGDDDKVTAINNAFSRAYQSPITNKQKIANVFTGENNDKQHLKNRALLNLNLAISTIYSKEAESAVFSLARKPGETEATEAKSEAETAVVKATEALDVAKGDDISAIIAKTEESNNSTDAAKDKNEAINVAAGDEVLKKFSPEHLQMLIELRDYIKNEGRSGVYSKGSIKLDYNNDIGLGANSSLYRLRFNLEHMTFWDDRFKKEENGKTTFYPGWEKAMIDKKAFETVEVFLNKILNTTDYAANNNAVSRSSTFQSVAKYLPGRSLLPKRGGRATRKYKKIKGSRSRNYYNKSRKYY